MRKLKLLLPLLLLLLVVPAQAQGGLMSIINSDAQFTLLSQAIEAADPSIEELLSGGANVTLLAPNNTAFENLASFLDLDLDLLFAQQSIITDLLLYHMLDGTVFSPQLTTQYDGTVLPTYLENAFVNVDVLADGTIQLNDAVEITFPDQAVGGSVLHVVNDVLLNRVITRQLDDFVNEEAQGTAEPTQSATVEVSAEARVRVLNASSATDFVTLSLGDTLIVEELPFGAASEFVMVEPGTQVAQFADGAEQEIDVQGLLTLVFLLTDGEPLLLPIDQSEETPTEEARVVLVNALEGTEQATLEFDGEPDSFDFADEESFTIGVGSHTVVAVVENVAVSEISFTVTSGGRYLIVLLGTVEAPQLLRLDAPAATGNAEGEVAAESARQTLKTLLETDERFRLLAEALLLRDEDLLIALDGTVSYTVFAPTDSAIEALFSSAGVNSLDDLDSRVLRDIVRYHIVPGELRSDSLVDLNGQSVNTVLDGGLLTFGVGSDDSLQINNIATVTEADIVASNGVLHVVDEVLLPQSALDALGF